MPRVSMCKKVWRSRRHSPRCRHCFLTNNISYQRENDRLRKNFGEKKKLFAATKRYMCQSVHVLHLRQEDVQMEGESCRFRKRYLPFFTSYCQKSNSPDHSS